MSILKESIKLVTCTRTPPIGAKRAEHSECCFPVLSERQPAGVSRWTRSDKRRQQKLSGTQKHENWPWISLKLLWHTWPSLRSDFHITIGEHSFLKHGSRRICLLLIGSLASCRVSHSLAFWPWKQNTLVAKKTYKQKREEFFMLWLWTQKTRCKSMTWLVKRKSWSAAAGKGGGCPTFAGRDRGRRGAHLWSMQADERRTGIQRWRKRRCRSTDLWSACSLPGGKRWRVDWQQEISEFTQGGQQKQWNRRSIVTDAERSVNTHSVHQHCPLQVAHRPQLTRTDGEKHKQDVLSKTVRALIYTVWLICISCRTDLVVDEELRGHRQEAKCIDSWEEGSVEHQYSTPVVNISLV